MVTRYRGNLLNKTKLPIAKISTLIPVIPEKEYTYYRVRIRILVEENEDNGIYMIIFFIILNFFVNYCIYITLY